MEDQTGKLRGSSIVNPRIVKRMKRQIRRNPLQTSKEIFDSVGLPNTSKSTRCHILKSISKCGKSVARPPLKCIHREKRLKWAENNMKVNFENVVFTDECRETLDGPDGWNRGWYDTQSPPPQRLRRLQGSGGIMFWAIIINNGMVGPFGVKDGVKITTETYTEFLKEVLLPWYKKKSLSFRKKMILMHDNAPSHAARLTLGFLKNRW